MNQTNSDPEAATLAKIYRVLIEKSEQYKREQAQKKVMAGETATTIPGDNSIGLERNHQHE